MVSRFLLILLVISTLSFTSSLEDNLGNKTEDESSEGENSTRNSTFILEGENSTQIIRQESFIQLNGSKHIGVGKDMKTNIRLDHYLSYRELKELLKKLITEYGHIVKVSKVGLSAVDRALIFAVQISRNVQRARKLLKPMVKLVANIDGDDAVGYALMTTLIQYLVYSDGHNDRVTRLLNTTDIWIVPTMNPDGLRRSREGCDHTQSKRKGNGNGVDLDTDFPARKHDKTPRQPETSHMLKFIKSHPFVLSGNLQGGAIVASYFLEDYVKHETDNRDVFENLAKTYAEQNEKMATGTACDQFFPGGISDGTSLGKKDGSMQYANFVVSNCFELTLHLSCCKHPPDAELPDYWFDNKNALLAFMEGAQRGIYGVVTDTNGHPVKKALISVRGKQKVIQTNERGEYWRLLEPGRYAVTARAPAVIALTQFMIQIPATAPYVELNFQLSRQGVYGFVTNEEGEPVKATVLVVSAGSSKVALKTTKKGEYWQFVQQGLESHVTIVADGYLGDKRIVKTTQKDPYIMVNFKLVSIR